MNKLLLFNTYSEITYLHICRAYITPRGYSDFCVLKAEFDCIINQIDKNTFNLVLVTERFKMFRNEVYIYVDVLLC